MPTLEPAHQLLQPIEPGLRLPELDLQEVRGAGRLPFARFQVLLRVERRESIRDARNSLRVATLIRYREGHRSFAKAFEHCVLDLELSVPAHASDGGLEGSVLPQLGIEAEALDQFSQPSTAQNFLADRIESELDGTSHSRPDE